MTTRRIRIGVQMPQQHTTYAAYADAVRRVDALGIDTIWNWDHFFPLSGDPNGWHFEGWTLLTAIALLTRRAEIGCLVTCNSYRNPALLATMAKTVDHICGGRLILGIGAGWFARDYREYGYPFGTAASRLRDLAHSLPIIKARWQADNPKPIRNPIPILIGGGGERVTLRLTAQHADLWNSFGPPDTFRHKNAVLTRWCQEIGRDPTTIERTVAVRPDELERLDAYVDAGAEHIILTWGTPWDLAPVERLLAWRERRT